MGGFITEGGFIRDLRKPGETLPAYSPHQSESF